MIKQNLSRRRLVIEHYQELIRCFGDDDPTAGSCSSTSSLMKRIMRRTCTILLVAHEGTPFLKG